MTVFIIGFPILCSTIFAPALDRNAWAPQPPSRAVRQLFVRLPPYAGGEGPGGKFSKAETGSRLVMVNEKEE